MRYFVVFILLLIGCERQHPATPTVEKFAGAVQYQDVERAWSLHVLSTDASQYCADSFVRVISAVKEKASDAGCEEARALTDPELEGLPTEARLIAQVTRTVCEDPTIDCTGYSRRVFESQWDAMGEIDSLEVKKVLGDEANAAAYVDMKSGKNVEHRTIKLVTAGEDWRVESGFFKSGATK